MGNVEGGNVKASNNEEIHEECIAMCCNTKTLRRESRSEIYILQKSDSQINITSTTPTQLFHQMLEERGIGQRPYRLNPAISVNHELLELFASV